MFKQFEILIRSTNILFYINFSTIYYDGNLYEKCSTNQMSSLSHPRAATFVAPIPLTSPQQLDFRSVSDFKGLKWTTNNSLFAVYFSLISLDWN